jgi:uncharacterized membrane protein
VTIVDAVFPGGRLRHHLWWVAVSLSLALNVFFVGGALWTRFHTPPPLTREERFDQVSAALALDPQQRQDFARYSRTMHGWLQELHNKSQPLFRAVWSEVSKPQADEAKVMQLLDQAMQLRRGYQGKITAATIVFLKTLSPEQRAEFIKVSHQGPPPWSLQFPRRQR